MPIPLDMDILKYIWEEPVHLEALSADTDPDPRRQADPLGSLDALLNPRSYYRGYLAGTRLPERRVGCTALAHPEAFVQPLREVFAGRTWTRATDGEIEPLTEAEAAETLRDPATARVLIAAPEVPEAALMQDVATAERRYGIPALRRLLDEGAAALFPEPAHDGWDWSLFAPEPLKDRLVAAFRRQPVEGARRFVVPYLRMRGEHRFYFEQWQLDALPDYIEEV